MKELNSDFTNTKVGDSVYHCSGIVGKVVRVDGFTEYPIHVEFNGTHQAFTFDGRYTLSSNQTLFTHPVAIIHADDLENIGGFKERVMEVSDDGEVWKPRVVFGKCGNFYMAWDGAETIERVDRNQEPDAWKFAREINHRAIEIKEQIAALQKELETIEDPTK